MKKEVLITIQDVQDIDGDLETIEFTTAGKFYRKENNYYLAYKETEENGFGGCTTTLKVEPCSRVTITRLSKNSSSRLVVEKGIRHQCYYDTGFGDLMLGVMGSEFASELTDKGGSVRFAYSLDVNTSLASHNTVTVSVQ